MSALLIIYMYFFAVSFEVAISYFSIIETLAILKYLFICFSATEIVFYNDPIQLY